MCRICGKCFKFDFSYEAHLNSHEVPIERKKAASVAVSNKNGDGTMKEFIVEIVNEPGQPMARSVTIDPENFMERFVEPPVGGDEGTENSENMEAAKVEKDAKVEEEVKAGDKAAVTGVMEQEEKPMEEGVADTNVEGGKAAAVENKNVEGEKTKVGEKQLTVEGTDDIVKGAEDEEKPKEEVNGEGQDAAEPVEEPKVDGNDAAKTAPAVETSVAKPVQEGKGKEKGSPVVAQTRQKTRSKRLQTPPPLRYDFTMGEDKPYVCDVCNLSFRWEISYTVHIQTHDGYPPQVRKKRPYRRVPRPSPSTAVKEASEEEEEATTPKKRQKRRFVGNSRIVRRRSSSESDGDYDEDISGRGEDGVGKNQGRKTSPRDVRKSIRKAAQSGKKTEQNKVEVQNGEPTTTRRTKRVVEVEKKGKPTPAPAATASKRVTRTHPAKPPNANGNKAAVKKGKTFTAVVAKKSPLKKSTVVSSPMSLRRDALRTRSQRTGNTRGQVDGSMDDMSADDEMDLCGEALPRILEGDVKGDALLYGSQTSGGKMTEVNVEGVPVIAAHLSWRRQLWRRRSLYPCRYCEKFFTTKSQRASHLLRHIGRHWYTCTTCTAQFPDHCSLMVHQLAHLPTPRCYRCSVCAHSFTDKPALAAHRQHHVVSKSVACTVCGKRYGKAALLAKHEADHVAGIFTCNICHKSFTKRHAFDIHQKSGCIFSAFSTDDM